MRGLVLLLALVGTAEAHDIITTTITWDREISRIFYQRCVSCHREGGTAFALTSYAEARPWGVAIKEEIQRRRMPPWGAIKGFGEFRNDQALTAEEMERIVDWLDGGAPEGEPKDLGALPAVPDVPAIAHSKDELAASGDFKLRVPFELDGLLPEGLPEKGSFQITAERPDGSIEPLVWLFDYKQKFAHPFLFRNRIKLPQGTMIRGIPEGARVVLLPAPKETHAAAR